MLSKDERKERNQLFWSTFKKIMRQHRSSSGSHMNWISYPSDVKDIYIRMEVDYKGARLCMDIQPKNEGVRAILFEQMTELKKVLEAEMKWETLWIEQFYTKEGHPISRICWMNDTLDYYKNEDWPQIMEFLRDRLLEFDKFYMEFKDVLITLAE
ncbi:MAG: DUF4268 domain-containing protein [Bacteroidota bacterium]|jgi:hypothetical protein